jgi:4-amino-4-deoxy-L-arabinose transferase-like glycosyltransferase
MNVPPWAACCLFILIAAVIRVPHFFAAVIEWDESTFILMGQSLVDGHLPYVDLWDNKPPLCFVPFALVIALFGKSIVAVRALGLVCVVACAWLVRSIALRLGGRPIAFTSGVACIGLVSYSPSGMATMSEVLAIVPLAGALALTLRQELHGVGSFAAGACLSIAFLIRTNLALAALAVVVFLLLEWSRRRQRRLAPSALLVGLLAPWIVCVAPYAALGLLPLFVASVFVAPFSYAGSAVLRRLVWHAAPVAFARVPLLWSGLPSEQRRNLSCTATFAASTLASILVTGTGTLHYGVQFMPFAALIVAFLVDIALRRATRRLRYGIGVLVAVAVLVIAGRDTKQAAAQMRASGHGLHVYGQSVEIAAHIGRRNPDKRPVLMFSDHLAYWFMAARPMSKIMTHPTNVLREGVLRIVNGPEATTVGELERVFALEPLYVVRHQGGKFATRPEVGAVIEASVAASYTLEAQFGESSVYRRIGQ